MFKTDLAYENWREKYKYQCQSGAFCGSGDVGQFQDIWNNAIPKCCSHSSMVSLDTLRDNLSYAEQVATGVRINLLYLFPYKYNLFYRCFQGCQGFFPLFFWTFSTPYMAKPQIMLGFSVTKKVRIIEFPDKIIITAELSLDILLY